MGSAVLGIASPAPGTHPGQSSSQRRVPRARMQGFEESRNIEQQQELAQSSAPLHLPSPQALQPEFRALQGRMAAPREQCQPSPLSLHPLSPPSHVPPGSRPALGLCCSPVGRGILPGCVCWAGTFPIPLLSLLPENLFVCSGVCHESLKKTPNPIGHQPQGMVLVPSTR